MSTKSNTLLSTWGAFFVAHALSIQKIEKALSSKAPLSLHEYDILLMLDRSPEKKLRYSDLATISIFTKSGITRIIKRLENKGYIDRQKCEEDLRGAFAKLNKKGSSALKDTWSIYSKEILKILDPVLSQEEAEEFENILAKIIDELRGGGLVRIGG